MKSMQWLQTAAIGLAFVLVQNGYADQLENEAKEAAQAAPAGVMVKVNPDTKTVEVFRAEKLDFSMMKKTANDSEIKATIETIDNPKNKIAEYKLSQHELDKDSSTEAWHSNWYGRGWRWNNWCGNRPYYYNWNQPYAYQPGGFSYGYSYRYNYSWNYRYNNSHYGWYY